jgi:putative transport protein
MEHIMSVIAQLLRSHPELALFTCLSLGYFLGRLKIGSFGLGTVAATLLVGVVIGLANIKIDSFTKSCFFYLFIFAIGYKVGPQFFQGLRGDGLQQVALTVIFCLLALGTVWGISMVMGYDKGLAAGLMSGAVTESATIGSSSDAINTLNISPELKQVALTHVAVGYSVTYLFGSAGVTWFLSQMAPKILRTDIRAACKEKERELSGGKEEQEAGVQSGLENFVMRAFKANGGGAVGQTVAEIERRAAGFLTIERVRHEKVIGQASLETRIVSNDVVALFGRREQVLKTGVEIGEEVADADLLDIPLQTLDIVVTNKAWEGRTLRELGRNSRGVRLKKLIRMGHEVTFLLDTKVHRGDTLQVIGAPENVKRAAKAAGYAERPTPDADLTFLAAGIVLGVLIGIPALMFKGVAIGLGTSGGVLMMGLILGYLRSRNPVFGKLPAAAGWLLETLGLNTFIAIVGLGAGLSFVSGLKTFGVPLFASGIIAVLVPHTLTLLIGKKFFPNINRGVLVGICCGAGTNTPALLATQEAADSKVPVLGYAVPYAIGNVLIIAWGPVLVHLIPKLPTLPG